MVRNFAAILCLAFVGAPVSAGEPPDFDTDSVKAEESAEAALDSLSRARRKYEFVRTASAELPNAELVLPIRVRLAACEEDLLKAQTALRRAVVHMRILTLIYASIGAEVAVEYLTNAADRIQQLVGDKNPAEAPFAKVLSGIEAVRLWLENPKSPLPKAIAECADALRVVEGDVKAVARDFVTSYPTDRLKRMLLVIREAQSRIRREIVKLQSPTVWEPARANEPLLFNRSEVVLGKGDQIILKHQIAWRQYQLDELEVKVTASDPSLTVPATLKLEFEKHQFRFEYEVKAGDKAGEFTVTLTPAVGKPVAIKVTVK